MKNQLFEKLNNDKAFRAATADDLRALILEQYAYGTSRKFELEIRIREQRREITRLHETIKEINKPWWKR